MHDPMTVAFEIPMPWRKYRPWPAGVHEWEQISEDQRRGRSEFWRHGYRESLATIWHVDPETDGSDDSCGWSFPKLTKEQLKSVKNIAWAEAQSPWLRGICAKSLDNPVTAECLCRAGLLQTARVLGVSMSVEQATLMAIRLVHNQLDNLRASLCLMPGYHTNSETDDKHWREELAENLYRSFARAILTDRRRWYESPRWHLHHWRLQVHFIQSLKRWLFSRCAGCGERFPWGFAPSCTQWDSDGPRWFRGEKHCYCKKCGGPAVAAAR